MSGMAEVLAAHWAASTHSDRKPFVDKCDGCGAVIRSWAEPSAYGHDDALAKHQAEMLTAAGFGPVKEAAAAGVRSIYDIWGAGGRATVRLRELSEVDASILAGDWDSHVKWNMGDIARERARAAAIRAEQ